MTCMTFAEQLDFNGVIFIFFMDQSRTFAASAIGEQLVTRRTETLEAADGVPTLVLTGLPELALVYICRNIESFR